jgi:hypothetical protein
VAFLSPFKENVTRSSPLPVTSTLSHTQHSKSYFHSRLHNESSLESVVKINKGRGNRSVLGMQYRYWTTGPSVVGVWADPTALRREWPKPALYRGPLIPSDVFVVATDEG